LTFRDATNQLSLTLEATDPIEKERVENLDSMFKLSRFWGNGLESQVQDIQTEVVDHFQDEAQPLNCTVIRTYLKRQASTKRKRVGTWSLAFYDAALYEFVANDDELVDGILCLL
jgi:hypothetical protein